MPSPFYTREDQVNIRVSLDGVPYGNSWDSIAGGGMTASPVKIRVGGKEINIGGPAARDDVTVGIQMSDLVAPWRTAFDKRVGSGVLKVSYTLLDPDLNVIDGPHTYVGLLNGVTPPDMDKSNSSPGPAKFTIVLGPNQEMAN
jgi:hypothetical protein